MNFEPFIFLPAGASMNTTAIVSLFSLVSFAGVMQDEVTHTKDSFEKIQENLEAKKAVIVDVREKSEWNAGHLKGAILIPYNTKLRFAPKTKKLQELPNDDLIVYCHCKAGVRALRAAKKLKEIGYDVRPIKAGFAELVENGFEKAKKK